MSSPRQRLILLFDGTWMDSDERTNVFRMAAAIAPGDGTVRQRFFYQPGVGTRFGSKALGGATGAGLTDILVEGYEWLARRYEDGDEVWVFGFSRGAYTARSLVGMLRKCGLMRVVTPTAIRDALDLYRDKDIRPDSESTRRFQNHFARPEVAITFLGVWDTVGALGVPGTTILNREHFEWHDTKLSRIVRRAYHAVALDEHRHEFDVSLWVDRPDRVQADVEQRWFIGSHGDVGGGCPDDRLASISLRWMQDKAMAAGLRLAGACTPDPDAHRAPVFDSYATFCGGLYPCFNALHPGRKGRLARLLREHPTRREAALGVTIDPSVYARMAADPSYDPLPLRRGG